MLYLTWSWPSTLCIAEALCPWNNFTCSHTYIWYVCMYVCILLYLWSQYTCIHTMCAHVYYHCAAMKRVLDIWDWAYVHICHLKEKLKPSIVTNSFTFSWSSGKTKSSWTSTGNVSVMHKKHRIWNGTECILIVLENPIYAGFSKWVKNSKKFCC